MTDGRRDQILQWLEESAQRQQDLIAELSSDSQDFEGMACMAVDSFNLVGAVVEAVNEELPDEEAEAA